MPTLGAGYGLGWVTPSSVRGYIGDGSYADPPAAAALFGSAATSGTIVIEFDMGDLEAKPYMYPQLAQRIAVDWAGAGGLTVDTALVELVGRDGTAVTLCDTPGTYRWPVELTSTEYAGSWAQDYGVSVLSDTGVDVPAGGISAATMADTVRSSAFELLPGRTAQKLRFTFDWSGSGTIELEYPTFFWDTDESAKVYPECAAQQSHIQNDGSGTRYGNWSYWDYIGNAFQDPPTKKEPNEMPTALDGLASYRTLYDARAADDGLDAQIATIYDSEEYTARGELAADDADNLPVTHSFSHMANEYPQIVLVNSYRACPPLAGFPHLDRTRATLAEIAGSYVQKTWSHCPTRNWLIAPVNSHLFDSTGNQWTVDESAPSGWHAAYHQHVIDNSEALDFEVRFAGTEYANVRPWRGYLWVYGEAAPTSGGIAYDVSMALRHAVARITDAGDVELAWASNYPKPLVLSAWVPAGLTGVTAVALRWSQDGKQIYLYTVEAGSVKERSTNDLGATYSMATTIGSGTQTAACISRPGQRFVYRVDSGAILVKILDPQGNTIKTGTAVASGVDDAPIAVDSSTSASGELTIILWYIAGGSLTQKVSPDGVNFT